MPLTNDFSGPQRSSIVCKIWEFGRHLHFSILRNTCSSSHRFMHIRWCIAFSQPNSNMGTFCLNLPVKKVENWHQDFSITTKSIYTLFSSLFFRLLLSKKFLWYIYLLLSLSSHTCLIIFLIIYIEFIIIGYTRAFQI